MIILGFCWTVLSIWSFPLRSDEAKTLQVRETDACPTDQSSWEKASHDLNCTSTDRYQCTSNENQTALLEYCYDQPSTFVLKGHCWILLDSHYLDTYSCSEFTEGCPNTTYRSNELYKYQQCLQLNKRAGCYRVDKKCLSQRTVTSLPSIATTIPASDENSSSNIVIGLVIVVIVIVIIIIVSATLLFRRRKFGGLKCSEGVNGDEEMCLLEIIPRIEEDGENIVLRCILPKEQRKILSNAIWSKDGEEIKLNNTTGKYSSEDNKFALVIKNASHLDTGEYMCCLEYANGCERIVKFSLDCPKITLEGIKLEGQDVLIEYAVSVSNECISLTTMSWRKNGCSLKLSDELDKYAGGTIDDSFLKICNVNNNGYADKYECTVKNVFGEVAISCVLDDIQCRSKEGQGFLLCCLLLDEFRLCKMKPEQWEQKLKESWKFCCGQAKEISTENALTILEFETLRDHIDFKDNEYRLISPDSILHSFVQRSGFLDFFIKYSTIQNIGTYCRSPGYKKDHDEVCCNVSPEQFKNLVQRLKFDILYNNSIADKTCHQIIEDELSIPKGILGLGKGGISKYLDDLGNGEHRVFVARGMLVGCEGAGKTSLLLRLQGKNTPDPPSTRGVDVHVNAFTVDAERLDVTTNQNKPSLLSNLINEEDLNTDQTGEDIGIQTSTDTSFEKHTEIKESKKDAGAFTVTPLITLENNEQVSEVTKHGQTEESEVFSENVPNGTGEGNIESTTIGLSGLDEEEVEIIDFGRLQADDVDTSSESDITLQTLSESFTDKDRKIVTFFDFAGQFAYYACHHIYFSPNDFYILVLDITKKLDDLVYKDRVEETSNQEEITKDLSNGANKMERSVYSGWTYLEFTEYWLQSILSHTVGLTSDGKKEEDMSIKKAPLILVATHAEGTSKKDAEAFFRDLRDKLPKLSVHVDYRNAFCTGFSDDLKEIEDCILKVIQTLPNWGKNIPMSWFYIENQIRKQKKLKIISFEEFLQKCISSNTGVQSHGDLITPLQFLNNIGVILFFDEENLRNFVILDVQWFVDAFKHVITDAEHAKLDVDQKLYEDWKSFNETGLLTISLLQSIWSRCSGGDLYISKKTEILSCMIRLNLLTEVSKQMWYCPCMNKQTFPTKEFENLENSSLLCFQFNYLPKDMFHRVIAACSNQLKWKIFKMEYLCIYQMATLFDVIGSKVLVGMYSNNKIVVQFLDISETEMFDYLDVRGKVTQVIDGLAEKLVHCIYDVGYMCKKTVFGKSNVPLSHFIAETEMVGESINCSKCGFRRKVNVKEIVWKKTSKKNRQENHRGEHHLGQTLTLDQISTVNVIGLDNIPHIGNVFSGNIWLSDKENILKINMSGITQKKIPYRGKWSGGHTLTDDGDLLYVEGDEIKKLSPKDENSLFAKLHHPGLCIHSSRINGDVLVGIRVLERGFQNGMIIRFDKSGKKLKEIEKCQGRPLYINPRYICENISGEICVSDDGQDVVIVVSKDGYTKFIYSGQKSEHYFHPRGLCSHPNGNLLICNASSWNSNVQILDQDGHFLCLFQHGLKDPMSICMDENNYVYIGQIRNNTIKVYRLV